MTNECPCGSALGFTTCCKPIIEGTVDAITAQALMRSRYTAFTIANGNYLMRSHHSSTRPSKEQKSIEKWAKSVKWIGLTILNTKAGETADETGFVEFKALFIENGELHQIHEKSYFVRQNQKWKYVSGEMFE